MKRLYCTESQEHLPLELFAQGKAVWCGGKPYLATEAQRLGLRPDSKPPADFDPAPPPAPASGAYYCNETQERLHPEMFAKGDAIWCQGKPYLTSAAKRLGLRPDTVQRPVPLPPKAAPSAKVPKQNPQAAPPPVATPAATPAAPNEKVIYCTLTQERIPPDYFSRGKAIWIEGKAYLISALREKPIPIAKPAPLASAPKPPPSVVSTPPSLVEIPSIGAQVTPLEETLLPQKPPAQSEKKKAFPPLPTPAASTRLAPITPIAPTAPMGPPQAGAKPAAPAAPPLAETVTPAPPPAPPALPTVDAPTEAFIVPAAPKPTTLPTLDAPTEAFVAPAPPPPAVAKKNDSVSIETEAFIAPSAVPRTKPIGPELDAPTEAFIPPVNAPRTADKPITDPLSTPTEAFTSPLPNVANMPTDDMLPAVSTPPIDSVYAVTEAFVAPSSAPPASHAANMPTDDMLPAVTAPPSLVEQQPTEKVDPPPPAAPVAPVEQAAASSQVSPPVSKPAAPAEPIQFGPEDTPTQLPPTPRTPPAVVTPPKANVEPPAPPPKAAGAPRQEETKPAPQAPPPSKAVAAEPAAKPASAEATPTQKTSTAKAAAPAALAQDPPPKQPTPPEKIEPPAKVPIKADEQPTLRAKAAEKPPPPVAPAKPIEKAAPPAAEKVVAPKEAPKTVEKPKLAAKPEQKAAPAPQPSAKQAEKVAPAAVPASAKPAEKTPVAEVKATPTPGAPAVPAKVAEKAAPETPRPQPAPKKWRKRLLIGAGVTAVLLAAAIGGALLYFNDQWFTERLRAEVKARTGCNAVVGGLQVSFWNSAFDLRAFKLLNPKESPDGPDILRAERITGSFNKWPFLFSGFKKFEAVNVAVTHPELFVERTADGSSLDEIIARLTAGPAGAWPRQTGLQALDFNVTVDNGEMTLRDAAGPLGVTKVSGLRVSAQQKALGQPTRFTAQLQLTTPESKADGALEVQGNATWIDTRGVIDPASLQALALEAKLSNIDAGQLTRLAGVDLLLPDGKRRGSIGPGWTGTLTANGHNLNELAFETTLASNHAIAIRENTALVADQAPLSVTAKGRATLKDGRLQLGNLAGAVWSGANLETLADESSRSLNLSFNSILGADDTRSIKWSLAAKTADLLALNVPKALGLNELLSGNLAAGGGLLLKPGNKAEFNTRAALLGGFITIAGLRQSANWELSAEGAASHDDLFRPKDGELAFQFKTESCEVSTKAPLKLEALNNLEKLRGDGALSFRIFGEQFWNEFGPLLAKASLNAPLQEALDGEITLRGDRLQLHAEVNGTLQKQQADQKVPIAITATVDYDAQKLGNTETPWVQFVLQLKSKDENGVDIAMKIAVGESQTQRIVEVSEFTNRGQLNALNDLNARFGAYAKVFLGPKYTIFGGLDQTGRSRLVQTLGEDGKVSASELALNTTIKLNQSRIQGPALVTNAPPLDWNEENMSLQLALNLNETPAATTLRIDELNFQGGALALTGTLGAADVAKLKAAANGGPNAVRLWADALPKTIATARAAAASITRLQSLGILRNEPLLAGDLELSAQYDPTTHAATFEKLTFKGAAADAQLVCGALDVYAIAGLTEVDERRLKKWVEALPDLDFKMKVHPPLLRRLPAVGTYLKENVAVAEVVMHGKYTPGTQRASLDTFTVTVPDFSVTTAAANVNVPAVAGLLDTGTLAYSKWAEVLPDLKFDAKIGSAAVKHLSASGYWPNEALAIGDVEAKGSYAAQPRQAQLERLNFKNNDLNLKVQMQNFDVPELARLLETPGPLFSNWLPVLPDLKFDVAAQMPAIERLQQLKILPADTALRGNMATRGVFEKATKQWRLEAVTFKSPAIDVSLAAPAIDIKGMATFMETAKKDPGAALRLFGDFSLEVSGSEQIFDALRERKFLPANLPVDGTAKISARYDHKNDRMNIDKLTYTAKVADAPVKSLQGSGSAARITQLLNDPAPSTTKLLDAFDQGLQIDSAVIAPAESIKFLKTQNLNAPWFNDLVAGVYRIDGPVTLEKARLKSAGKPGAYLASFSAKVKAAWHPRPAPNQPPQQPVAAALNGTVEASALTPLKIDLDARRITGGVALDQAALTYPNPYFPIDKKVGVPVRFYADAALDKDVLRAATLDLTGGPLPVKVVNLVWHTAAPKLKASFDRLLLAEGANTISLNQTVVDQDGDKLQVGRFVCPVINLQQLGLKVPAERVSLTGALQNVNASYNGRISALTNGFTAADKVSLQCFVQNLQLVADGDRGRTKLSLGGDLGVETGRVYSTNGLGSTIEFTPAGGEMRKHQLAFTLDAKAKDGNVTLLDALRQDGLPLIVKTYMRFDSPLEIDPLIDGLRNIAEAVTGAPANDAGGGLAAGLQRVNRLRVEATLTTPFFKYADIEMHNINAQVVVLDDLKIGIQNAKANMFGGEVQIAQAGYDLTAQPLAFNQTVNVNNISLAALTGDEGKPPVKDKYQLFGRLSGTATLSGQGLRPGDRRTWNGSANLVASDVLALKNGGQAGGTDLGKAFIGGLGGMLGGGLGRAAMFYSANFGLFLNRLEFEPAQVQLGLEAGKLAIYRNLVTGKGPSAGLQFGYGGYINLQNMKLDPGVSVWPTYVPDSTQRAMGLYELDANERQQVLNAMSQGSFYLTFTGKITDPSRNDATFMNLFNWIDARIQAKKQPVMTQPAQPINVQGLIDAINQLNKKK